MRLHCKLVALILGSAFAGDALQAADADAPAGNLSGGASSSGSGFFGWLNPQSAYQHEYFPQPILVDDTSLEADGEVELNTLHTAAGGRHSDQVTAEVQKSFGLLTLELAVPYERSAQAGRITQGLSNIELGARYPVYQTISRSGFFDNTLGAAVDFGIPASSVISINPGLEPKIFDDLKLGERFSVQSVLGWSTSFGGGDNGGEQDFEYGFDVAAVLSHRELPLPGVRQLTPMIELVGEKGLNLDEAGRNSLLASLGFRADLKPLGDLNASFGLAYVMPVDNDARREVHWGIATSLIIEF